jgi:hypothetical protein
MKELDFDELDRAVNSLMTNVPTTPAPKKDDDVVTLNIESSTPDTPVASSIPVTAAPLATPTTLSQIATPPTGDTAPAPRTSAPTLSVAARRGAGRFMDVVHPSSDMKKPTVPVSRQGATIEPSQSTQAQPPAVADPELETPAKVTPEPSTAGTEWPDPLDVANFDTEDTSKVASKPVESTLVVPELPKSESLAPKEPEAPLTTPFLPDAKVEKRPLGSPTSPVEEPDHTPILNPESSQGSSVNDPDDQLPAIPKDVEPILPAELQGDLMAIEADTNSGIPKTEEGQPIENILKHKPMESSVTPEPPVSTGPTSIPQQYREEPSTGDQGNGAIYDTDTYHKPIEHPAKKKSGWMWVIWILVILVVGAGGGAALFFLKVI